MTRKRSNRYRGHKPRKQTDEQDAINPLDFFDLEMSVDINEEIPDAPQEKAVPKPSPRRAKQGRAVFIAGTDTGVGKTVVTSLLGMLLKEKRLDIGVMKPVQCGGNDAVFLKEILGVPDELDVINPYRTKAAVSPHIALRQERIHFDKRRIKAAFEQLRIQHDLLLVEGAGGLLVPLQEDYLLIDLIRDLGLEVILVARQGLGTINHTLLSLRAAKDNGITVKGIIFNQPAPGTLGVPEKTNPAVIRKIGKVPVLGKVPFLTDLKEKEMLRQCRRLIDVRPLLRERSSNRTSQWQSWDKQYVWHPFTQMKDWEADTSLIIAQGDGSYLQDTQGNRYIDGVSSLWVNVHGHRKAALDDAIKQQMSQISHSTMLGLANVPAVELARRLVQIAPPELEKVFYSDNGSTAVEVAVKMAYQYWQNTGSPGKKRIVCLEHAYHGDTLGSVSVGGMELFHKVYERLTFRAVKMRFPDFYRAPRGKAYPDYAFEHVDRIENLFKRSAGTLAALIVEPLVQGAAGMLVWPPGLLKRLRELCTQHDVFLIADEVATGFGRTGKMFACEHENVSPDFLCLAKGITGGYLPLAATMTTKRVFDGFVFDYKEQKTFFHGHTYTGNPLGCAAALANLDIFAKERVLSRLQPKIKYLQDRLKTFQELRAVGDIRQCGFMVGIELVRHRRSKQPFPWHNKVGISVCEEARKRGVILRPLGNVVVVMPPLSISQAELRALLDATYAAIKEVTEKSKDR